MKHHFITFRLVKRKNIYIITHASEAMFVIHYSWNLSWYNYFGNNWALLEKAEEYGYPTI